jgi:hypothetical protein
MEKNTNNQSKAKFENDNLYFDKNKNNSLKNTQVGKCGFITKNIFLSLPKLNNGERRINKSFLKTLNLTIHNKRNKTIDSLYQDSRYENTNKTLQNINKNNIIKINIIENDNINGYNIPRNNRFTVILGNSPFRTNYQKNIQTNFNTTFKNSKTKKFQKLEPIQQKINKSLEHPKTQNDIFFQKKPSIDYITPIFKNMKTFKLKEEPDLKKINVGELMNKVNKKRNNICLLIDEDKNDNKENINNFKKYFKMGNKFSSNKMIKEKNEFYSKIKMLNIEKENKIEKKNVPINNCHEILEYYKNNRFENCRKLIEQTLLDVKKEKNIICEFFDNYKKVFDEFDDWNAPKNKDNLYN